MTATTRKAIVDALFALVTGDAFFPQLDTDPGAVTMGEPEPTGWRVLDGGLQDCVDVSDQLGPAEVTAEVQGDDADVAALLYELNLKPTLAYACIAVDKAARRDRVDQAAQRFEALIGQDRTLGVDPQVYCRIAEAERRDDVPAEGAATASTLIVTLEIDYVAASPAG